MPGSPAGGGPCFLPSLGGPPLHLSLYIPAPPAPFLPHCQLACPACSTEQLSSVLDSAPRTPPAQRTRRAPNSCSSCCISAAQHGMQLGDLSSHAVCLPKGHSPPPMQPLLGPGLAPAFSPRSPSQGLAFRPPDVFVCPASCLAHRFLLCVWFSKLAYWTQDRHISLTAPPAALGTLVSLLFFS